MEGIHVKFQTPKSISVSVLLSPELQVGKKVSSRARAFRLTKSQA